MDSTHSRPWDTRPALDNSFAARANNGNCEHMFAARITSLLEERQNLYKNAVLDKLYRLRSAVVAIPDAENQGPGSNHIAIQPHLNYQPTYPVIPTNLPDPKLSKGGHTHSEALTLSLSPTYNVKSKPVRIEQSREADHCNLSHGNLIQTPPQPHSTVVEVHCSSSTHSNAAPSVSSPQVNVQRFAALRDVMSAYRYFTEVFNSFSPTTSPSIFVTYGAGDFPTTASHNPLSSSNSSNFFTSSDLLTASPHTSSRVQLLQNTSFKTACGRSCHHRIYVPPLLVRLFFEQEAQLIFDSQFHITSSTAEESLARATKMYNQKLFPARPGFSTQSPQTVCSSPTPSRTRTKRVSSSLADNDTTTLAVLRSSNSVSTEIVSRPRNSQDFQRRTFYRSLTRKTEHRAPTAAWRDDNAVSAIFAPRLKSQSAYAASGDVRGHPSYMSLKGVHSCPGETSVTLTFGFQRRTNYPFRKTYMQKRSFETTTSAVKDPPKISAEFASRVPIRGLSPTLLHLFQPEPHRGLFYDIEEDHTFVQVEQIQRQHLHSIGTDGKLVVEQKK